MHTNGYAHLTFPQRRNVISEMANCIAGWNFAHLFAECIDKIHFDTTRTNREIGEQAFEQVVSRFERYLTSSNAPADREFGMLVHDNYETVARKHTEMMRKFHANGTLWTNVNRTIETPLFVDSKLTRMVQIADLCSYALRRYCENQEEALFEKIFRRADRARGVVVGVRHYSEMSCTCKICLAHRRAGASMQSAL